MQWKGNSLKENASLTKKKKNQSKQTDVEWRVLCRYTEFFLQGVKKWHFCLKFAKPFLQFLHIFSDIGLCTWKATEKMLLSVNYAQLFGWGSASLILPVTNYCLVSTDILEGLSSSSPVAISLAKALLFLMQEPSPLQHLIKPLSFCYSVC